MCYNVNYDKQLFEIFQKQLVNSKEVQKTRGVLMSGVNETMLSKLILLFVFDKMEVPISEETITDMCCIENDWIPQMFCHPLINQLLDSSFIYDFSVPGSQSLFTITPEGRVCLAHFFVNIPASIRESISEYVKNNRIKIRRKQEYITDYYKNADGSYTVVLKIIEPGQIIFELKLKVNSRQAAKTVSDQWEQRAPQVYASTYDMLID